MLAAVAMTGLVALAGSGCGTGIGPETCDRSIANNPPKLYTQGLVEDGIYLSTERDKELLHFPGGMHYKIEHKLGQRPRFWQFQLSFDRVWAKGNALAGAVGNQAELRCIDETWIVVANASCVDYWLLVMAGMAVDGDGGAPESDGGAPESDAGVTCDYSEL
jgi:hypothetical protein